MGYDLRGSTLAEVKGQGEEWGTEHGKGGSHSPRVPSLPALLPG